MFNDFICRFTDTMSFVGILLLVTIASAAQGYRGKKLKSSRSAMWESIPTPPYQLVYVSTACERVIWTHNYPWITFISLEYSLLFDLYGPCLGVLVVISGPDMLKIYFSMNLNKHGDVCTLFTRRPCLKFIRHGLGVSVFK